MDIGTKLREARLQRGLTLKDISNITKIPSGTLQALECNNVDRVPQGLFVRAFIRAYAAEVGLDPEGLVREYLMQCSPAEAPGPGGQLDEGAVKTALPSQWHLGLVLVLAVALAAYGYHTFFRKAPAPVASSSPAAMSEPVGTGGDSSLAKALASSLSSSAGVNVDVHPRAECWVAASADLRPVVSRLIQPGEHVKVQGRDEVVLRVSDGDACTFSVNGLPGRAPGRAGKPALIRITKENYRTFVAADDARSNGTAPAGPVPIISPPRKVMESAAARPAVPGRDKPPQVQVREAPVAAPRDTSDVPVATPNADQSSTASTVVAEPAASPTDPASADNESQPR